MRVLLISMLIAMCAAIQTSVLPLFAFGGFRPDLLLLLVVAFAVQDGPEVGVRLGFVAGLTTDLLLETSSLGVASLTFALVGYAVGVSRPYLAPNSITAPLVLGLIGSTLGALLLGGLGNVLGDGDASLSLIVTASLYVGVINTILIGFVLKLTRGLSSRFPAEGTPLSR
ncbi:MAG: rod shape-determining protein MreD [Myxococcota bacterium]|jgi:rod shape-determining protein MreD